MKKFENISNNILVTYDREAVVAYLNRKKVKMENREWIVDTFFDEDDLQLVILDKNESMLICFQDFYVNEDSLIDVHNEFKKITDHLNEFNVFKMAKSKLSDVITMLPVFQEYYYKYNQSHTSKVIDFEQLMKNAA